MSKLNTNVRNHEATEKSYPAKTCLEAADIIEMLLKELKSAILLGFHLYLVTSTLCVPPLPSFSLKCTKMSDVGDQLSQVSSLTSCCGNSGRKMLPVYMYKVAIAL